MTSLCQKITSSASKDLEGPDDLKLTLPSIRELLSRSDSSELLEHLSRGAYVTHSPPIVLPSTVGVNLPLASGGVENDRWEEGKQFKSRYVREFRGSFARSGSSAKDENDDSLLTLDFMASFSDENESNPDTSVVPRERRKSFIFNDYALSKEGSPERERAPYCQSLSFSDEDIRMPTLLAEKLPPITRRRRDCSSFASTVPPPHRIALSQLSRTKTSRLIATDVLNRLPKSPQPGPSPVLQPLTTVSAPASRPSTSPTRWDTPSLIRPTPFEIRLSCTPHSRTLLRTQVELDGPILRPLPSSTPSPSSSPSFRATPTSSPKSPSLGELKELCPALSLPRHEHVQIVRTPERLPSVLEEMLAPMGGRNMSLAPRQSIRMRGDVDVKDCVRRRAHSPVSVTDSTSPCQSYRPVPGTLKMTPKVNRSHD